MTLSASAKLPLRLAEIDALAHYTVLAELDEVDPPLAERLTTR